MADFTLDATGLRCPMPLLKTKLQITSMTAGQQLEVVATDPGSARDIPAWLSYTRHRLIDQQEADGRYHFVIGIGGQD